MDEKPALFNIRCLADDNGCTIVCLYGNVGRMKRTALFLEDIQVKKLQKLSEKTGAPVAELIRRAIDAYLKERAKEIR